MITSPNGKGVILVGCTKSIICICDICYSEKVFCKQTADSWPVALIVTLHEHWLKRIIWVDQSLYQNISVGDKGLRLFRLCDRGEVLIPYPP